MLMNEEREIIDYVNRIPLVDVQYCLTCTWPTKSLEQLRVERNGEMFVEVVISMQHVHKWLGKCVDVSECVSLQYS